MTMWVHWTISSGLHIWDEACYQKSSLNQEGLDQTGACILSSWEKCYMYVICVIEVYTYYLIGWWWVFGWYLVISVSFLIPFLLLLWLVIRYFYGCTLIISKHDPSFLQFQSILLTFNDRKKFDTSLFESLLYALLAICIM